jgi:hypothetical protein
MSPLILLATALLSTGPDWSATFEPAATASYLDRPNAAVLVVAAGGSSTSAVAAAGALAQALRTSRQTRLVMTGESLAVAATDDDVAVVKKAAVLPVDLVVVVRTFPGTSETAVATVYDKAGSAISAMAGPIGQPLPRKEGHLASNAARDAVRSTVRGQKERDSSASTFDPDDEHITYRRYDPETPMYKGRALSGPHFYEVTKKPELASQFRGRVAVKVVTIVVGSILLTAAPVSLLFGRLGPSCLVLDRATGSCQMAAVSPLLTPALIAVGGLASLIFGIAFAADPLSTTERYQLTKAHNNSIDEKEKAPQSQATAPLETKFAVSPIPGGLVGAVQVTF